MRTLSSGNKMNFAIFIFLIFLILFIIVNAVFIGIRNQKQKYQVSSNSFVYDNDYKYIELENDAEILKKWNGDYYLQEEQTKKEYKLGNYAISYETTRNSLDLFGNFYLIQEGGNVSKYTDHNTINNVLENKFFKIDDRKYLIIAKEIKNNTGSLYTQNYLIVILDKLGNALLLNNELNMKIINEMIITTDEYEFDVANEILRYKDENINLKKVIGSTNEYVYNEEQQNDENNVKEQNTTQVASNHNNDENKNTTANTTSTSPTMTTTTTINTNNNNNNSTTIIENNNNVNNKVNNNNKDNSNNNSSNKNNQNNNNDNNNKNNISNNNTSDNDKEEQDTAWVDSLNDWIKNVASGFESIYNNSSNKKEDSTLSKSIMLNGLSAGTSSITINYTIVDPENKYNVVYAVVSSDTENYTISLDKSANTYKLKNLQPDTNYTVKIGYKIIYSDAKIEEVVQDTMEIRTNNKKESLEITRVGVDRIYYKLKLDSDFLYDPGCKLVVYLNDETKVTQIELNQNSIEKAATGYSSSFKIPKEYKIKGSSITIRLEDTKIGNSNINTNLNAKIINY